MAIFFELLIITVVSFVVGYPLFSKKKRKILGDENFDRNGLPHLLIQKEVAYETLKDLDFDFRTGKLSEEDFQELKARYREEALNILEKIDKISKKQPQLAPPKGKKKKGKKTARSRRPLE